MRCARATWWAAVTGRAMAVPRRYVRAYTAPARSVRNTKPRTNSSRRSSITQSVAPERLAFSTSPLSSPAPCPTSAAKHITRAPYCSRSQGTIAAMIIPTTDTPGARAAQVHRFIDLLLAEWASDDERAQFLKGLADVDARARTAFGGDFLSATDAQRGTILTQLDAEAQRGGERGPPPFFHLMKWVTVYGYCTSEVGATAELHYEVIPGSYDGCTELGRSSAGPGDF